MVISELLSQGLRIPEDVSVIGFGDFSAAQQILPHLTTVRTPGVEIGRMTVRRLADLLSRKPDDRRPLRIQVPCSIIERESAGPARIDPTPAMR